MVTIGEELKRCRNHLRMTLPEMASKLNVSTTTIVNYETGKRVPDMDFLVDFASICEKDLLHWLKLRISANKSPAAAAAIALLDAARSQLAAKANQSFASLPLYDIKDAANAASASGHERVTDEMLQYSAAWIKRELNATPADLFQILVDDESMEPALRPGDTILLDRRATKPDREGVYILQMNGVPLIKRLQILPGGIVKAVSDNPAYETFTIPMSDINGQETSIIGRVVWVVWAGRRI